MPVQISQLRLAVGEPEDALFRAALLRAGLDEDEVQSVEISRQSLDRRREVPVFCYTLDVHLKDEASVAPRIRTDADVRVVLPDPPPRTTPGTEPLPHVPVVIGTGPAGFFAAWWLAQCGYRPLVLERGEAMNRRVTRIRDLNRDGALDGESNYLFGEGGAGTFSDGKLTSRSKDPRARRVLDEFRQKSGIESVGYYYRPHLGSERVRTVVGRIRKEIEAAGGTIRYGCAMTSLTHRDGRMVSITTADGEVPAEVLVLAPGHSARELYRELAHRGVAMERKPFQLGLRVEHPQDFVDESVWGAVRERVDLGPADYRLSVRCGERSVFSFCMCPGGEIIPAVSDVGMMNTNGMSHTRKNTGFANSGIVTTLEPDEFGGDGPLAGIELQEHFESLAARAGGPGLGVPAQRLLDFLTGEVSTHLPASSCQRPLVSTRLAPLLPKSVALTLKDGLRRIERQMRGFLSSDALLVGPEARSSAPVRLPRDPESLEGCGIGGFYPIGEGAGYAGGIVSAAVDGLRAAEAIVARYRLPTGTPG